MHNLLLPHFLCHVRQTGENAAVAEEASKNGNCESQSVTLIDNYSQFFAGFRP